MVFFSFFFLPLASITFVEIKRLQKEIPLDSIYTRLFPLFFPLQFRLTTFKFSFLQFVSVIFGWAFDFPMFRLKLKEKYEFHIALKTGTREFPFHCIVSHYWQGRRKISENGVKLLAVSVDKDGRKLYIFHYKISNCLKPTSMHKPYYYVRESFIFKRSVRRLSWKMNIDFSF